MSSVLSSVAVSLFAILLFGASNVGDGDGDREGDAAAVGEASGAMMRGFLLLRRRAKYVRGKDVVTTEDIPQTLPPDYRGKGGSLTRLAVLFTNC